ncbi:MAG: hypothetical protein EBU49_07010 [Proteobacteria bacterium]|nr:hypothetical protein [Pseudomonadota bacterium]
MPCDGEEKGGEAWGVALPVAGEPLLRGIKTQIGPSSSASSTDSGRDLRADSRCHEATPSRCPANQAWAPVAFATIKIRP